MKLTADDLRKLKTSPPESPPREVLPYLLLIERNRDTINEALELGNLDIAKMLIEDNQEMIETHNLIQYLSPSENPPDC